VFRVSFLVQGGPCGSAPPLGQARWACIRHPRTRPSGAPGTASKEERSALAGRAGHRDSRGRRARRVRE
jgi:hypothetical protein